MGWKGLRSAVVVGAAAFALGAISGTALAAEPVVYAIAEGQDVVARRPVLILTGKYFTSKTLYTLQQGTAEPELLASWRSGGTVVLQLPPGLAPGPYTLNIGAPPKIAMKPYALNIAAGGILPEAVADGNLTPVLRADLDDAATLGGHPPSWFQDASNLTSGTLSTDRFSAIADLIAEGALGTTSGKVAPGDHSHDARHHQKSELSSAGTFNASTNPVDWTKLKNVPTNLVTAGGEGLSQSGGSLAIAWPGSGGDFGTATTSARSDHAHDARYFTQAQLSTPGTLNLATNPVDWTKLKNVPAGFGDGTDDVGTAGNGLTLTSGQFSVNFAGTGSATSAAKSDHDHDTRYFTQTQLSSAGTINTSSNPVDWTKLKGVPSGFADGLDDIGTAGTGLNLIGSQFIVNFVGSGSATSASRSDHNHDGVYTPVVHDHDPRYFTQSQLNAAGTINTASNPVDWTKLKSVPGGIADGVDDIGTAGAGLTLSGGQLSVNFGGAGAANTAGRSDHTHTGTWVLKTGDSMNGALTINTSASPALDVTGSGNSGIGLRVSTGSQTQAIAGYGGSDATSQTQTSIGVYGYGGGYGVYGYPTRDGGSGVYGDTPSNAGSYGVYGRCQYTNATAGVYAESTASGVPALVANQAGGSGNIAEFRQNGTTVASINYSGAVNLTGCSASNSGTAVSGQSVYGIGVEGTASGTGGIGVRGFGYQYGVYGTNLSSDSYGVYGTGGSGGVYGVPTGDRDSSYGVFGDTLSNRGYWGVYGRCQNTGGVAGVYAECSAAGPAVLITNHTGGSGNNAVFRLNGSNVARIDRNGRGYFNGGTQTSGADFAESVAVNRDRSAFEPGDVIVVDVTGDRRFALSRERESTLVAGVYSTKPALLGSKHDVAGDGAALAKEIPLGIMGIVPTKVCDEGGPIARGDLLVAASVPGHAMRAPATPRAGTVLGKALGTLDKGSGTIEVLLMLR